jgi:RNA polymerase sigma-70 factor, ECF subfamily
MSLDFAALYVQHAPEITRYAYRLLGSPEDAADVCGDVFAQALKANYEERGGGPRAWLFHIAHDRCVDVLRKRRKRKTESLDVFPDWEKFIGTTPGPERELSLKWWLEDILPKMTQVQRQAFWLHFVQQYTLKETAEAVGVTMGTIKGRYHRALRCLAGHAH